MTLLRRLLRGESATSTVEFALVIPVLLIVLLTGFDFTRALLAYTTINSGSREGARYAVLHPTASRTSIERAVEDRTRPLSKNALRVTVEWKYADDAGSSFGDDDWPPPANRPPRDVTVRVSVEYPWSAASAIAAGFLVTATSSPALVSTSSMDMRR
jgi:Flp pilus assembly protein TadG